jgi:hypothetical protein
MSYTLRGRLESRLAALALPVLAACLVAVLAGAWWPVELAGAMVAALLALDLVYHPLLSYQPGWAALPLGALELGAVMAAALALGVRAPLAAAVALFAAGWLAAQLLGHALLPLWRLSYAEDGGELGRSGPLVAVALAAPFAAAGGIWWSNLPPVVHLAAGVHQGPIVITRREHLVGDGKAVVLGGIVVRHADVTVSGVHVLGGENGITVEGYRGVVLKNVSVTGARLDGIHVRRAAVRIDGCRIDMRAAPYGQGIDVSYTADQGETVVRGCTVIGGLEGIAAHSAMAKLVGNRVESTSLRAIDLTEMSMGSIQGNTVRNANGVGINCGDRSTCMVEGNRVVATRADSASGDRMRAGFGLLVEFGAEAEVGRNDLAGNPAPLGVFLQSQVKPMPG